MKTDVHKMTSDEKIWLREWNEAVHYWGKYYHRLLVFGVVNEYWAREFSRREVRGHFDLTSIAFGTK